MPKAPLEKISLADTAKWVAYYRAMESARPDAIFKDPYARKLAGPRGEEIVEGVPRAKTFAWPMIVRTATMDELLLDVVQRDGVDFVLNLAAGLDARPYRLTLPPDLRWVEVDYPQTIDYKSQILASESPRCRLERIGADLADVDARRALFSRLNTIGTRGLVITEGLMVYLTRDQAGVLAQDLADMSNTRLWILDIAAPFVLRIMQRSWASRLAADSAVFRFAPAEGAAFYAPFGWQLRVYRSAFLDARRYHREHKYAWLFRMFYPRMVRQEATRRSGPMTGTVLLQRTA
jgi:methyltransferase (TIGR00027 family)